MSKFHLFSKFNRHQSGLSLKPKKRNWSAQPKFTRLVVIGLLICFGIFYLVQINQVSTQGFKLKSLEEKVSQLKIDNEKLEIEAAQMKSLERIKTISDGLGLKAGGEVFYLESGSGSVAAK